MNVCMYVCVCMCVYIHVAMGANLQAMCMSTKSYYMHAYTILFMLAKKIFSQHLTLCLKKRTQAHTCNSGNVYVCILLFLRAQQKEIFTHIFFCFCELNKRISCVEEMKLKKLLKKRKIPFFPSLSSF